MRDAYAGTMPVEFVDPVSEQERANKFRAGIRSGTRTWLMAVAGNELVGACALGAARDSDVPLHSGEIMVVAVASPHRRHGHGLTLLNAARSVALDRGWRQLVLWVVATHEAARAFYARAGFRADGREQVDDHLGFSAPIVRYRTSIVDARGATPT
jgi:GNAT superfamily N-acetyltransferase